MSDNTTLVHDCQPGALDEAQDHDGSGLTQAPESTEASRLNRSIHLPGSDGEHKLQAFYDSTKRAAAFYKNQVLDHLNSDMRAFIARQEMIFVGTADRHGEADVSFRAGETGFVRVINRHTLTYPEYRGNGVMASLGNISENKHVGMLFVDFNDRVGLHVNGFARIVECDEFLEDPSTPDVVREDITGATTKRPERWVLVSVVEAYIHCSKHIPRMRKIPEEIHWGTDDVKAKGGDYFRVRTEASGGS